MHVTKEMTREDFGYASVLLAGLGVMKTKPFYFQGGRKGYPESEPWGDVQDVCESVFIVGPAVVRRVIDTLNPPIIPAPTFVVDGTTTGQIHLNARGRRHRYIAPLSAIRCAIRRSHQGRRTDDRVTQVYPAD